MRELVSFFLLFLAVSSSLEDSVYRKRLADVVIEPVDIQDESSLFLFQKEQLQASSIPETEISGIIANALLPSSANVFISIEGADQGFSPKSLEAAQKLQVVKTSYPQDELATLTSIATGQKPSVHGIVGKTWTYDGDEWEAYRAGALPEIGGIADKVSSLYEGKSITFSFSADLQLASATAIHQYTEATSTSSSNNYAYFFDHYYDTLETILHREKALDFSISKNSILDILANRQELKSVLTFQEGKILFQLDENQFVSFELKKEEDLNLFVELGFTYHLLEKLRSEAKAEISDSFPDLYFLSFSSIRKLVSSYGRESSQIKAAYSLLDILLAQVFRQFSELYSQKVSFQVVFLAPTAQSKLNSDVALKEKIWGQVKGHISRKAFEASFPILHLKEGNFDASHKSISGVSVSLRNMPYQLNLNTRNAPRGKESAIYQIVIWVSIILVFSLYAVIYAIYTMDVGEDSLIYRMTNLNNVKKNS